MDLTKTDNFERYMTTTRFTDRRDPRAAYDFYEKNYDGFLPGDKAAAILDIGCGAGEFVSYLKKEGYSNAAGIDASPEAVDFCEKNGIGNVELVRDLVGYLSRRADALDLASLNDTIEHLPKEDVVDVLKAVRSSLKKGGLLLVRTGNFSTFGGIYLRYKDFTHEAAYTESSLAQVLRLAGFEDVVIFGNRYSVNLNLRSVLRTIVLKLWFLVLKLIYLAELGNDRPKIYSKLLIAVCRK